MYRQDLGFALVRRIFPVYMRVEVTTKDSLLINRVQAHSLDAFVFKCVTAYLHAVKHYGANDLWDADPYRPGEYILPDTIRDFNYSIRAAMNPLWKMLESDLGTCREAMTRNSRMCITQGSFVEQYYAYCKSQFKNEFIEDLTPDVYLPVFSKFGIKVEHNATRMWKDKWVTTTYFDGIGFDEMCAQSSPCTHTHMRAHERMHTQAHTHTSAYTHAPTHAHIRGVTDERQRGAGTRASLRGKHAHTCAKA